MTTLLNGRALAASLRQELKVKVAELSFAPTLGVVLVGDDPASHLYVSLKEQTAHEVGIKVEKVLLPASAATTDVQKTVQAFNLRPDIHGILVQLPLPIHLDEHAVINTMDASKDADGFHPQNLARLMAGEAIIPPGVSAGIMKLIEMAHQPLVDKHVELIVNSDEFAQPLVKLLTDKGAKANVNHRVEPTRLRQADIIIIALGQPRVVRGENIKDGAIVIDVGTTKIGGHVVGDVDADSLTGRPVYLTPVPGGVGPMTVVMLLWNVYHLAKLHS